MTHAVDMAMILVPSPSRDSSKPAVLIVPQHFLEGASPYSSQYSTHDSDIMTW